MRVNAEDKIDLTKKRARPLVRRTSTHIDESGSGAEAPAFGLDGFLVGWRRGAECGFE